MADRPNAETTAYQGTGPAGRRSFTGRKNEYLFIIIDNDACDSCIRKFQKA